MDPRLSLIECAYHLARSGECRSVADIVSRLKAEGYANVDLEIYSGSMPEILRMVLSDALQSVVS